METTSGAPILPAHVDAVHGEPAGCACMLHAWLPAGPDACGAAAGGDGRRRRGPRVRRPRRPLHLARGGPGRARLGPVRYDLRGHGQSSGRRGQVSRFDEYLDDTEVFLDEVRRAQPGKPVFLLGHSMGGLVCARLAEVRPPDVTRPHPLVAVPPAGRGRAAVPGRRRQGAGQGVAQPGHRQHGAGSAALARRVGGGGVRHGPARPPRGAGALGGRDCWARRRRPWPSPLASRCRCSCSTAPRTRWWTSPSSRRCSPGRVSGQESPAVRGLLPRVLQRDGPRAGLRRPRGLAAGARLRRRGRLPGGGAGLTLRSAEARRLGRARSPATVLM